MGPPLAVINAISSDGFDGGLHMHYDRDHTLAVAMAMIGIVADGLDARA